MAKVPDPRTGETTFTDPQDPAYTRDFHNEQVGVRGSQTVLYRTGPLADRPQPGVGGRVYESKDGTNPPVVYWDTGTAWLRLSEVGGGGTPRPIIPGGGSSAGSSVAAAAADHVHALAMASPSQAGAMSAEYAKLLTNANGAGDPGIAMYDSSGRIRLGAHPLHDYDAATRKFVLDNSSGGVPPGSRFADPDTTATRGLDGIVRGANPVDPTDLVNLRTLQARENDRWVGYLDISRVTYGGDGWSNSFRDYLNGQLAGKASSNHMHNGGDIRKTGGSVPWEVVTGSTAAYDNTAHGSTWATVAVDSAGKFFRYGTSTLAVKTNIRPYTRARRVLDVDVIVYDRTDLPDIKDQVGMAAEVMAQHVPELAIVDEQGKALGVQYQELAVHHHPILQDHDKRVQVLEAGQAQVDDDVQHLMAEVAILRDKLAGMTGGA